MNLIRSRRRIRGVFVGAFVTAAVTIGPVSAATSTCAPSKYRSTRTLIIAHAGGDYFGPPNTIEMMRAAKAAGADILDTDIRTTSDGIIVAAHDDTIPTTSGGLVSIAKTTYADLLQIDLGDTWAGPAHDHPLAGHNVHVPSLDAVLRAFPHDRVGIELKTTGDEASLCTLLRTRHRTGRSSSAPAVTVPSLASRPCARKLSPRSPMRWRRSTSTPRPPMRRGVLR